MTAIATRVDPDAATTARSTHELARATGRTGRTGGTGPTDDPTRPTTTTTTPADGILTSLRAALQALADVDPDALDSRAPVGRATVPLAGTARCAVAALGGYPGMALTQAPGIVVGRDLVAATDLLATTARSRGAGAATSQRLAGLALDADRRLTDLLTQLHGVVTRRA
jgi:hypothetical protein